MSSPLDPLDLNSIKFRAKIDFVRIGTPGHVDLPPLDGVMKWGAAAHYRELTIHDPSALDIGSLSECLPRARLLAVEVAVDLMPSDSNGDDSRLRQLETVFSYLATHLYPYNGLGLDEAKLRVYSPTFRRLLHANFRRPNPTTQVLYGLRDDQPVQVKVYLKGWDQKRPISAAERCVRMEVQMREDVLEAHRLVYIEDLRHFPYRRALSDYFWMAKAPATSPKRTRRAVLRHVNRRIAALTLTDAKELWARSGVNGAKTVPGIRFDPDAGINRRIGKALNALEQRMACKQKARRSDAGSTSDPSGSMACCERQ